MNTLFFISYCIYLVCFLSKISASTDSIIASQSLRDGETLVSSGGSFEVGFFSPGSSKDRYFGIWYKNIPVWTFVWVANRNNPIKDLSGSVMINSRGNLVLLNGTNTVVWSANSTRTARDPVVQLLDSGNLVLRDNRDNDTDTYLWQSFDYPSDTLLPDMKIGWDLRKSLDWRLSSWKSWDDPSPGEFSIGMEHGPYPQAVMWKGTRKYYRGGPWNGLTFSGTPELRQNPVFSFEYVDSEDEVYYAFHLLNKSVISRIVINETTGSRERYVWLEESQSWKLYAPVPRDYCDQYGLCGANGICDILASPVCQCLRGFEPRSPDSWNTLDWSRGCTRSEPVDCGRKHEFVKFSELKLPDTVNSWVNKSMNLKECRNECSKNCLCMAYTNSDISGRGSGCVLWFGDLVDVRLISGGGQDLYIRMRATNRGNRSLVMAMSITVPVALVCVSFLICSYVSRRKVKSQAGNIVEIVRNDVDLQEDVDLPLLDLATVAQATDRFSVKKKLGEGGFGPVYKGLLVDGQIIAVKRLSEKSSQGLKEFKNEVRLIAKLQHRNLVKLVGCCIEANEKILVYEYLQNGSLDMFLFNQTKGSLLNWSRRFDIICGIARGLLYLHQDSRLRIIHRDLKASNILLDDELNPKISDFGMARIFGGDQGEENTRRIVGTYGYMAPEYASYGLFSVKSDVFSFGILIMEILSGQKNRAVGTPQSYPNLIGHVWTLWTEGRPLDLMDPILDDLLKEPEMMRCIHVGLLCVQQNPDDRPNMSTVVLMLNAESTLPAPKQPGFLIDFVANELCSSSSKNDFSVTAMEGR